MAISYPGGRRRPLAAGARRVATSLPMTAIPGKIVVVRESGAGGSSAAFDATVPATPDKVPLRSATGGGEFTTLKVGPIGGESFVDGRRDEYPTNTNAEPTVVTSATPVTTLQIQLLPNTEHRITILWIGRDISSGARAVFLKIAKVTTDGSGVVDLTTKNGDDPDVVGSAIGSAVSLSATGLTLAARFAGVAGRSISVGTWAERQAFSP